MVTNSIVPLRKVDLFPQDTLDVEQTSIPMYYITPRSLVQLRERRNRASLFTTSAADDVSIKVKNRAGTSPLWT